MAQITVDDILKAVDEANTGMGRLRLQNSALEREVLDLSRRIVALTEGKDKKPDAEKS